MPLKAAGFHLQLTFDLLNHIHIYITIFWATFKLLEKGTSHIQVKRMFEIALMKQFGSKLNCSPEIK